MVRIAQLANRLCRQQRSGVLQRRGFADAHGEVKFNAWEKPTEIAKWKEEHIVFAVLGGWAVTIYSATKIFGGGKKEAPAAEPAK